MYVVAPTGLSFACRIFSQSDSKHHFIADSQIAVYLPFTYQVGGNTVIMSREYVVAIDVSAEDNLRFSATADLLAMLTTINAVHSEGAWRYRSQTHGQTFGQKQK